MRKLMNFIIFNKFFKMVAFKVLRSKITRLPIYQAVYLKKIEEKMSVYSRRPGRISIENTNICTADCVFCSHKNMKRAQGVMDMDLFKKVVDDGVKWGIDDIVINGFGEPLLDPYFFERVKYCKDKGVAWVTTNINARFINEANAVKLLESGIDEVYVSCNKLGEKNVKRFCGMKDSCKHKTPLIYLSGMRGSYEPPKYKGADGVSISFLHNWAGGIEDVVPYCIKDPCKFLWYAMNISWEGKVTICCVDYEAEYVLGDLRTSTLKQIWEGESSLRYKKYHRERNFDSIGICKRCTYNYHYKSSWWM